MEKTVIIDGKEVRFKSTGATPLRYKAQFGKDYFAEMMKLNKSLGADKGKKVDINNMNFENVDFEVFYNLAWTLAKTADKSIPDPMTWLDEFDEFPIMDILPEIQDLISASIQGKKK